MHAGRVRREGHKTITFKYYFVLLKLTMESITIKVKNGLSQEIDKAMKQYYSTKTEFIREAIRDKLISIKKEKVIEELRKHFGKAKVKTSENEERIIREAVGKNFARKYGVNLK